MNFYKAIMESVEPNIDKIAKKTNMKPEEIKKKLRADKAIKGYTTVLDTEKLGFEVTAIIEIEVKKGKPNWISKILSKHKNVVAVYDVTGDTDSMIIAKFKSIKELNRFVKDILSSEQIISTETHIVLETIYEQFPIDPRVLD